MDAAMLIATATAAGAILGGAGTKAIDYLKSRGAWSQDDKERLWSRIGALEERHERLQEALDATEVRLHTTQLELVQAQQAATNLKAGYDRLKSELLSERCRAEAAEARADDALGQVMLLRNEVEALRKLLSGSIQLRPGPGQ